MEKEPVERQFVNSPAQREEPRASARGFFQRRSQFDLEANGDQKHKAIHPRSPEADIQAFSRNFGDVMVVGGGISGIQAALDLATAGFKVYLVDKAPSIGGHMAQLDKTFPTNDCSI